MQEKRLTTRLISAWEALSTDDGIPHYSKFNPNRVEDLWQNCMVLVPIPRSSAEPQLTVKLNHVGDKLTTVLGSAKIGHYIVTRAKSFAGAPIIKRIDEVVETLQPVEEDGQFINDKSKLIKYRSCLLPFGTPQEGVTHVLVGISWREF